MRKVLKGSLVAVMLLMAGTALAGDVRDVEMRFEGPLPDTFPVMVTLNVWEGGNCDHLKGVSTAMFDGASPYDITCDAIACITDITIMGNVMVVSFDTHGYDNGKFKTDTCWETTYDGLSAIRQVHTSCSQPIFLDTAYLADPVGAYFFEWIDGDDCVFPGGDYPVDCPLDDKLYWITGKFQVPCDCSMPAWITVTYVESDHWDEPEGQAQGYWNPGFLAPVYNDQFMMLWGVSCDPGSGDLIVQFEAFGFDNGKFKSDTSFILEVEGCGTFRYRKLHTSCSRPIPVDDPLPLYDTPGTLTITNYCGCDETTIPVEQETWGTIKSMYR
jgi:hypothetical protein